MPTPLQILLDPLSLTVLGLYGALILLESLFPARPLPQVKGWKTRAVIVFVTYFYLSSYLPLFWGDALARYQLFNLESLNPFVGAGIGVLIYELLVYVWHRTMHRVHWVWRAFHQMHHSAERIDSFGAFYFSPLDSLGFTLLTSLSLTVVVGLSAQAVTYFLYATTFLAVFQHLNVRTPQWLGYLVQRPESHSVHHGRGIHQYNYSDLPLFDILFGTFRNPKDFVSESGFYDGASAKIPQLLVFRDIAGSGFSPAIARSVIAIVGLALLGSSPLHAASSSVKTYATGLTNPRGLTFGPDRNLYVAEAGTGGSLTPTGGVGCPIDINIYSPYTAGYSGRVVRVLRNGTKQVVADNLPSMTDNSGASYGPTDVAFIGHTLYVLIEMGGCSHGLPHDLPAILRINRDGSTTPVANLNAWHAANPPHFIKDTNPATTDQEPGGVFHSMIAIGRYLYVVETNRGFLLRVDPWSGGIETLYDMSIDNREHNPIVMTQQGNHFFVGTFGEDQGRSELAVFDKHFSGYTLPFQSRNPIVGLAWHCNDLYGVEIFPYDNQWSTGTANLVKFDRKTGRRTKVLTRFASLPNGLVEGPDGALYTSNWGISFAPDDGQVLRIVP